MCKTLVVQTIPDKMFLPQLLTTISGREIKHQAMSPPKFEMCHYQPTDQKEAKIGCLLILYCSILSGKFKALKATLPISFQLFYKAMILLFKVKIYNIVFSRKSALLKMSGPPGKENFK